MGFCVCGSLGLMAIILSLFAYLNISMDIYLSAPPKP